MSDVFEEAAVCLEAYADRLRIVGGYSEIREVASRLRTEAAAMRRVCEAAERTMRHLSRGGSFDSIDPKDARIIREAWAGEVGGR